MSIAHRLTASQLRTIVRYDPLTGDFFWIGLGRDGEKAGVPRKNDRRTIINIDGRAYFSYRLAWLWMTGSWPSFDIDHIDGNPANDRFCNLRDVSKGVNQQNRRAPTRAKQSSTYLGVYSNKPGYKKPWRALISVSGRQISLGAYFTEEEAQAAYLEGKRRLHEGCTL